MSTQSVKVLNVYQFPKSSKYYQNSAAHKVGHYSVSCVFCKQFGPRSGPTQCRAWSGSKLFNTLMASPKEFFKKLYFEKNQQTTKKREKLPSMQGDNDVSKRWNEFCVNSLFHSRSKIGEEQQPT